jgi:deoxyribonuclease-1-like protein
MAAISALLAAFVEASAQPATIKIASWNIQNFGQAKAKDPDGMRAIAGVLKNYDIIAVQEISNVDEKKDPGCPRNDHAYPGPNCGLMRNALQKYLNAELGLHHRFEFSPQVSDERYLYIYNPARVTMLQAALVGDPGESMPTCDDHQPDAGKMVRKPFKAIFRAGKFDFVLLTAHTSLKNNISELNGLAYFFGQAERQDPDVIALGDLNAGYSYLPQSKKGMVQLTGPGYIWPIGDSADTTVAASSCAYDRFIFKDATRGNFVGAHIDKNVTSKVSDHYLIWAEFRTDIDGG